MGCITSSRNIPFYINSIKEISSIRSAQQWISQCYLQFVFAAQKMMFFIRDFFSKCDQIRWKLQICSYLLKKSLIENFIFRAVILAFSSTTF